MTTGASIRIGKVFGIPIGIHISWFIIFFLVTTSLALRQFPHSYPLWSPVQYWVTALLTSLLFFLSVLIHELSHAVVAIRSGIPVRGITLFIFGGVAQIGREARSARVEALIAVVGPLSSLILGGLFTLLWVFGGSLSEELRASAGWLAVINVALAIFNLMPGFPLDGGRVFRAIVWGITGNFYKATKIAAFVGRGFAYLLIAGGVWLAFSGNIYNGIWFIFIGLFLDTLAVASYRELKQRNMLRRYNAAALMSSEYSAVSKTLSLRQIVEDKLLSKSHRSALVMGDGILKGLITFSLLKKVPSSRWDMTTVEMAMIPMPEVYRVEPTENAFQVIEQMDERGMDEVPVVAEGRVLGVVRRDNVVKFLRSRRS